MRAYRDEGFPITIVRPSLTYGDTQIALAINSWAKSYTVVDRMRRGKKVIVPGDGSSLWVITHNTDFAKGLVGLLAREQAIGHAFHITSDEVMCWDQWYRLTAEAAGVGTAPRAHTQRLHRGVPSPRRAAACWATKPSAWSSTIPKSSASSRTTAPRCRSRRGSAGPSPGSMPTRRGGRSTSQANALWDNLIEVYERGLEEALHALRQAT